MNISRKKYEEEIYSYLKSKYNEDFKVEKISRISTIGSNDIIYALCSSERFPNDFFEVIIKLSICDKYGKDEIVNILKDANVYDGKLDENPKKNIFKDNYINTIMQNSLDEKLSNINAAFVKTQITTPNEYIDACDVNMGLSDFFDKYGHDIVVYTSVFTNDDKKLDDNNYLKHNADLIVCDKLINQFIFYYATNLKSEEIKKLFLQNYEDNNEYFYGAPTTKRYIVEKYTNGKKG